MKSLLLLLIISLSLSSFAQDTLVYKQDKSVMFSNTYALYPKTKTFEHRFRTDDGQLWYGFGNYEVNGGKIHLNFEDSDYQINQNNNEIIYHDCHQPTDTITILFTDIKNKDAVFDIRVNDTPFFANFDGTFKIPKALFKRDTEPFFEYHLHGNMKKVVLPDIRNISNIAIMGFDFFTYYHFESNFTRTLAFKKNKMISEDFYGTTRRRKVKFVRK